MMLECSVNQLTTALAFGLLMQLTLNIVAGVSAARRPKWLGCFVFSPHDASSF